VQSAHWSRCAILLEGKLRPSPKGGAGEGRVCGGIHASMMVGSEPRLPADGGEEEGERSGVEGGAEYASRIEHLNSSLK